MIRAGVEDVDRARGGAGFGEHRHALPGDDDLVGHREDAEVGVVPGPRGPAVAEGGHGEGGAKDVERVARRPGAGRDQERAVALRSELLGGAGEALERRGQEHVLAAVAADEDGDAGARQILEARRPLRAGQGELLGAEAVERQVDPQDRGAGRHVILRRGHDEVEVADRRPRSADVDDAGAARGLLPDPAGHRLVAPARGDHEVGPGWRERIGALPPDSREGHTQQAIREQLVGPVAQPPDLEGPAQSRGQRLDLRVVSGLVAQQKPHRGGSSRVRLRGRGAHRLCSASLERVSALAASPGAPGAKEGPRSSATR